jgi:hypothetical protein
VSDSVVWCKTVGDASTLLLGVSTDVVSIGVIYVNQAASAI